MVVDQKLLNSQMMKYDIGSNVRNKISGQKATTPIQQTTPTVQQPIQQPTQQAQITNKTPVYDIKSMMGFSPQATKNQISTMTQFAQQQQANRPQANIQTFEPMTNNEGLTVHKTASFRDLIGDLKYGAEQGKNLSFMELRQYYPEYVENWSEVLDLYESIKANPNYTTEQITQNAQKAYPELFGNTDTRFSAYDKEVGLKKLYDEMVSNQKSGQAKLTRQDIINDYPVFANTQDISTIEEIQDMIYDYKNLPTKKIPTYVDIAENFGDLFEGEEGVGQTMMNELDMLDNISETQYKALSNEGQEYVKSLANLKGMVDSIRKQYKIAEDVTDRDIINAIQEDMPELYNEIVTQTSLGGDDRYILENNRANDTKIQALERGIGGAMAKFGTKTLSRFERMGKNVNISALDKIVSKKTGISAKTLDNIIAPAVDMALESQNVGNWGKTLEGKLEDTQRYNKIRLYDDEKFWDALKKGDWNAMLSKSGEAIGTSIPGMVLATVTGGGGAVAGLSFLPFASESAMEDIESDPNLSKLSREEKQLLALGMGTVESAIEGLSFEVVFPGLAGRTTSLLDRIGGQGFKKAMSNALVKGVTQTELGALSEGGEEVLQKFFGDLIAKGAGSDRDLGTAKEYWDIFTETFLSSQLLSAMGGAGEGYRQNQANRVNMQELEKVKGKILEGQVNTFDNYEDYNKAMKEVFPKVSDKELANTWNKIEQKKYDLALRDGQFYDKKTVELPTEQLSESDNIEYNQILNEMVKNGEITEEQREQIYKELGIMPVDLSENESEAETEVETKPEGLATVSKEEKASKPTNWWTRRMSGLDKETITRIENNPYISNYWNKAVKMVEDEGLSMDNGKIIEQPMQELGEELLQKLDDAEKNLGEDGRMYKLIKDIKQQYDLSESRNGIKNTLDKYDISIIDGKLDFSDSQFVKAEDTNAISRAVGLLNNTNLSNITPKEYWNLRKKLSALAGFDKGTSKDGEAVVRQLRHLVDQLAKEKIPGLKKVDEIFSKEIGYLNEIKQGLVYQQGTRKGEIKDNFYSILKTINNQNRQQMNQRLEKIMPDLSDRVEAINMLPKLLKAYAVRSRLVELGARNIGKVGGAVTGGIPGLVVGYVFDEISGKVTKSMRKNAINKIVNNMSDTAKQRLEDIAAKQEEKETLTQEEKETLNQVKAEIEKIIEQENNEQKPQTQSETEKKSEKKTNKAEQVQAKKKNNQNTKPKTKGLAKINETKEETKTEGLANVSKEQTEEKHFTYDEYGEVMDKIDTVQKQINEKLDKQYDQERADLVKRFNELKDKDNKTDAEGKELQQLANQLNNLTNKYDRLKEEELAKQAPELLEQKNELQKAFDRDWTAMIDKKMNEINKPYNDLREEYQEKIRKELGLPENTRLTEKIYKGLTAEELEKVSKIQKEYEEKVKELENKEQTTKEETETQQQEGLAAISVKVENGKVVKESETEQKSETVETPQEFEVLPADVSVYDESKTTGPKRISPDRGGWWQQLTPKEAIDKKIEQITKDRQRRTEQYDKKLDILNGYIEKFGDSISQNDRSKEATEARKTIRNEIINPYRLGNFFTAGALGQIKEMFERWKSQQNTEITDKNREDINRDYIQHVKEDISHGYRYPEAVLSYNPEFRTAVDNRARYEKGLYTSFSTDDTRIVDYKKDQIGAGMKRQDGKELTQEQKDEIANGVINYQETMGIDIKRLAENNNWVYVHLNGKNPFLMGSQQSIAGLYRGSVDEKGRSTASISVGGTESYQIREDGKIVTKKRKTTMAHELTHALDALSSRKLLSESAYNDLRLKFNDYDSRGLHHSSYWTSKSEITARMVEEYVAVQNGDTEIFNEKGYWDQETYNSVIEPEINKIKNNFFQEYKEGIGGDSIEQIKADAITRGLAEISNQ